MSTPRNLTNAQPVSLSIVERAVSELHPHPRCPRKHPKGQLKKLAASIRTHGFLVPILVDGQSRVLAGHARLIAARNLGMSTVPTIPVEHLSEAQAQAFMLADNRLNELSSWDDQILGEILFDLSTQNLDLDLDELTGFDMGEIDLRIEELETGNAARAKPDRADAAVEPAGPAVSKTGDLWLLGRHRLLCGSALSADDLVTLMDCEQAAMVFTDPPYNVPIRGHVSGLGQVTHREFAMASGEMSKAEFVEFLTTALKQMAECSQDGSLHYICMDWRHLPELFAAGASVGLEQKNLCVWAKDNAGMGSLYRSQHELVLVYKKGRAPHRNNVELGRHGRNRTNVWQYPGVNSFARNGEEGNLLTLHPTVKPVRLVADAMLDATARDDIVLDPFGGSGTTLMAAERVGRRGFLVEMDPLYVDTIIRRWEIYTGEAATLADQGYSFAEAAVARASLEGGVP